MNDVRRAACGPSGGSAVGVWNIWVAGEVLPSSGIAGTSELFCYKQVTLLDEIRALGKLLALQCMSSLFVLSPLYVRFQPVGDTGSVS